MINFSVSKDSSERPSILHQPAKITTPTRKVQRLARLESEHQQNQNRMRQLHRRNQELAQEIRYLSQSHITQKKKNPGRTASKASHSKPLHQIIRYLASQLQTIHIGRYSLMFWLQAAVMLTGVGLVCGTAGFMLVRLITGLIG
jgi:seryl-tRNA synthetase